MVRIAFAFFALQQAGTAPYYYASPISSTVHWAKSLHFGRRRRYRPEGLAATRRLARRLRESIQLLTLGSQPPNLRVLGDYSNR